MQTRKIQVHLRLILMAALVLTLIAPLVAAPLTQSTPPLRPLDQLRPGDWTMFSPGGETRCARDTPYQFYVRPAASGATDKLLIYFQGGGACWNALTCGTANATFDDYVNSPAVEVGRYNGIFDFANPANPVADYNIVFVPYCTADVHVGDATVDYGNGLTIHHNGFKNTSAVLDWTYANFTTPQDLMITGSSAGAYGAIYYAPFVINQYPDAKVVQFGDAGVGATPVGWAVLEQWGMYTNMPQFVPDLANVDPATFTINTLYTANAALYPDTPFAQYTTAADEVQVGFYQFMVLLNLTAPAWDELMYQNLDTLDADYPNFASYVSGGKSHTILALPEFYTLATNGVSFRDWFAGLIAGEPVEDVRCEACASEEFAG